MKTTSAHRSFTARLVMSLALVLCAAGSASADEKPGKSLYDRLGRVGPISVVVDEFIERLTANELLWQHSDAGSAGALELEAGGER